MPWHIQKNGDRFCVMTGSTKGQGTEVKCHPTQDAATAHLRALYANVPDAEWKDEMDALEAAFDAEHPFGEAIIELAGEKLAVWVASTLGQKTRGMVARSFPEDVKGLLFEYPTDTIERFHMRGVPQPLALGFFDSEGKLVDRLMMKADDPWQYQPSAPFRHAIELPAALAHLLVRPECTLVRT